MKPDKLIKLAQDAVVLLRPKLNTLVYYGKVELIPPKPTEIGEITRSVGKILSNFKTGAWKDMTVKQAFLNMLVGLEVGCWFFVGECIGKRSLIGYDLRK